MSDLIDRQLVLDRINKQREHLRPYLDPQDKIGDSAYQICAEFVERIPSVQPKERCIATITLSKEDIERIVREQVEEIKEMLPRRGKWIYGEHDVAMCDGYRCDKCGFFVPWDYQRRFIDFIKDYNYCPSCGADMEVKNDYPSSHNIAEEP